MEPSSTTMTSHWSHQWPRGHIGGVPFSKAPSTGRVWLPTITLESAITIPESIIRIKRGIPNQDAPWIVQRAVRGLAACLAAYVRTLREIEARPGKVVEFDRNVRYSVAARTIHRPPDGAGGSDSCPRAAAARCIVLSRPRARILGLGSAIAVGAWDDPTRLSWANRPRR